MGGYPNTGHGEDLRSNFAQAVTRGPASQEPKGTDPYLGVKGLHYDLLLLKFWKRLWFWQLSQALPALDYRNRANHPCEKGSDKGCRIVNLSKNRDDVRYKVGWIYGVEHAKASENIQPPADNLKGNSSQARLGQRQEDKKKAAKENTSNDRYFHEGEKIFHVSYLIVREVPLTV